MKVLLKTKDELLNEGWTDDSGSMINTNLPHDIGYFSFWFNDLLGTELKVIDYIRDFYIAEPTTLVAAFYIPKSIVKEEIR